MGYDHRLVDDRKQSRRDGRETGLSSERRSRQLSERPLELIRVSVDQGLRVHAEVDLRSSCSPTVVFCGALLVSCGMNVARGVSVSWPLEHAGGSKLARRRGRTWALQIRCRPATFGRPAAASRTPPKLATADTASMVGGGGHARRLIGPLSCCTRGGGPALPSAP
jgi:hypothetical protein